MRRLDAASICHLVPNEKCTVKPAYFKEEHIVSERKSIDCRDYPSERGCTLRIEGAEEEVLDAAVNHAITSHGHTDNPGLREEIRKLLKPAN